MVEEGGMEWLKAHKVCFSPSLAMNGPAPLHGLGKKSRVPSYAKCKQTKTLESRILIRLAASRPRAFLSLGRTPRADATSCAGL